MALCARPPPRQLLMQGTPRVKCLASLLVLLPPCLAPLCFREPALDSGCAWQPCHAMAWTEWQPIDCPLPNVSPVACSSLSLHVLQRTIARSSRSTCFTSMCQWSQLWMLPCPAIAVSSRSSVSWSTAALPQR